MGQNVSLQSSNVGNLSSNQIELALDAVEHGRADLRKGEIGRLFVPQWALPPHELLPLGGAVGLVLGVLVYFSLPFEPQLIGLLGVLGGVLALFWVVSRTQRPIIRGVMLVIVCATIGGIAATLRTQAVRAPVIEAPLGPVLVEGWVTEIEAGRNGDRVRLRVHAIANRADDVTPKFVRVTHRSRLEVEPGRFVRCWAVLRPPPSPTIPSDYDFRRQAYFEQLGGVGYVQGRCRGGALGAPTELESRIATWLGAKRRALARYVLAAAGPNAGGFAAALSAGDRSFMPHADQEALRNSGLAHLLAISGLHLGIVGGLIYILVLRTIVLIEPIALRIPAQKPAALAALLGCFVYLCVSGGSVSTLRAFIMVFVFFTAVLMDRSALSFRSLTLALIGIVLLHPESVMTPGFQMSFAATAALISIYAIQNRKPAQVRTVWSNIKGSFLAILKTSVVAAMATLPFALYHFDRVAGLGILANVIAMPIISFVTAPLSAASLLAAPFGLAEYPLKLMGTSLEAVLFIARAVSNFEYNGLRPNAPMPHGTLFSLTVGLVGFVVWKGLFRYISIVLAAGAGWFIWSHATQPTAYWTPDGALYVLEPGAMVQKIEVVDGKGLSPLRFLGAQASQDCRDKACQIQLGARVWLKISTENCGGQKTRLIHVSDFQTSAETPCFSDQSISWPQIEASGSATTIRIGPGGEPEILDPNCTRRPWTVCKALSAHSSE